MTTTKTTLRGHCPCCGNLQAVPNGISKHGYTVSHGWFQGVCVGAGEQPIELSRVRADKVVADVRAEVETLRALVSDLEAGRTFPKGATRVNRVSGQRVETFIAWADLADWQRSDLLKQTIWNTKHRAKTGEDFANYIEKIANEFHGKPLIEEVKAEPAPRIKRGDKKLYDGRLTLEAYYTQGARVYYNGGKGWIGTQAWRRLPDAA